MVALTVADARWMRWRSFSHEARCCNWHFGARGAALRPRGLVYLLKEIWRFKSTLGECVHTLCVHNIHLYAERARCMTRSACAVRDVVVHTCIIIIFLRPTCTLARRSCRALGPRTGFSSGEPRSLLAVYKCVHLWIWPRIQQDCFIISRERTRLLLFICARGSMCVAH